MKIKRFLEQKKYPIKERDGGAYGKIFKISKDHCAKVLYFLGERIDNFNALRDLEKEYYIMKSLFNGDVSVPRPEGVYHINLPREGKRVPALVMELIKDGIHPWEAEHHFTKELDFLTLIQLQKAMNLGFIPGKDCYTDSENVLWSPNRRNVFLIDFGNWKRE